MSGTTIREETAEGWSDVRRIGRLGVGTVGAVLVANLLLRGVGELLVPGLEEFEPLGWAAVVATSVVVGIGAVSVRVALDRVIRSADRAFVALAAVVLLVSLVPIVTVVPTFPGVTPGIRGVMVAMHVVSAAVAVAAVRSLR